ncbi:MAG TPA: CAP domain-containing protein, partial [Acidimicrobiales bacterium]|nr:CAP domain-containing protein [Acidimicrobiales bacterium]
INSLRESHGLAPLQVHVQVTGVARRWTDRMAGAGQISHNPNLANDVQGNWTKLGENVGVGRDVDGLMRAFINSPAHYANLVDPSFNYVGVGVTFAPDGHLFTTHDFMALDDQPVPAPAPQAFAPSPPSAPTPDAVPPATPAVPTPASPQRVSIMLRALRDVER